MNQHIYISASINTDLHDVFVRFILEMRDLTSLTVYLTSPGGNPYTGQNLYSFMKSLSIDTTVYNLGTVDSAAVLFFLGFKQRFATDNATFMVHQTKFSRDLLPAMYTRFDLLTALHELEAMEEKTERLILKETSERSEYSLDATQLKSAIFHTTVSDSKVALKNGFIDGISHPTIPRESTLYLTEEFIGSLKKK